MLFDRLDLHPVRLGPFIEELRARLDALSRDELNRLLLRHAKSLDPEDREDFLALFSPAMLEPGAAPEDDRLLPAIDAFVMELEEGSFFDGVGWDDEILDERAWGDESWAPRMDLLFLRAGDSFVHGHSELAAAAYQRLFHAFQLEEDGPVFSGPLAATEMLQTDLPEAVARFLRAVYETVPPSRRPAALRNEIQHVGWLMDGGEELLGPVEDARESPLPDLDEFLPAWIDELERAEREPADPVLTRADPCRGWERLRRALLREAVKRRGGAEGLAALARRSADPQAFLEWCEVLARRGDLHGALTALGEGLDGVPEARDRAFLAGRLAALAAVTGQRELAFCCRRLAWQLGPTPLRLRQLTDAADDPAPTGESRDAVLDEELQRLRAGELSADGFTVGLVELLCGDFAAAARRLAAEPAVGWSGKEHSGPLLFPVLVVAGAGLQAPPEGAILHDLWQPLDGSRWCIRHEDPEDAERSWVEDLVGRPPAAPRSWTHWISAALGRCAPGAEQRTALLATCRSVALDRARYIVSNKLRGAYDRAAVGATACAEGFVLAGASREAGVLLAGLRKEFPRHSSFQRSLDGMERRSALLGGSPLR